MVGGQLLPFIISPALIKFDKQNFKSMNLQADIKWIQSELDKLNDPTLIELFVRILKKRKAAISSTLETYNQELDEANARIEAGKFITQEDLEKEAASW